MKCEKSCLKFSPDQDVCKVFSPVIFGNLPDRVCEFFRFIKPTITIWALLHSIFECDSQSSCPGRPPVWTCVRRLSPFARGNRDPHLKGKRAATQGGRADLVDGTHGRIVWTTPEACHVCRTCHPYGVQGGWGLRPRYNHVTPTAFFSAPRFFYTSGLEYWGAGVCRAVV